MILFYLDKIETQIVAQHKLLAAEINYHCSNYQIKLSIILVSSLVRMIRITKNNVKN